jgi:hypothetical protein
MAHRLRSKVKAAEAGEALVPVSLVECRRDPHAPAPESASEAERRRAAQRRSDRHHGLVERAAIVYRGKPALVRVVNASSGGVTIETAVRPDVGEPVSVALEGHPPRVGEVRWLRHGQIGVAFA